MKVLSRMVIWCDLGCKRITLAAMVLTGIQGGNKNSKETSQEPVVEVQGREMVVGLRK